MEPDLTFEERITRGNYVFTDSGLTEEKFPVTANQVGKWEWKLFRGCYQTDEGRWF